VIIVALKPYNVKEVLEGLKQSFNPEKHIIISVVTGVSLKRSLGHF
jgi:pyrroline-5-carboxylate reductase